jgi:ATP-dependent Lon protease
MYNKSEKDFFLPQIVDGDPVDTIPLLSPEEEELMHKEDTPEILPILPVRNTVLFPGVVIPVTVSRQKSIRLVKKSYRGDRIIGVVAQDKVTNNLEAKIDDLYQVGTVAKILRMLIMPDGNTTIIIQGQKRFRIKEVVQEEPFITAKIDILSDNLPDKGKKEVKALIQSLKDSASKVLKLNPDIPQDAQFAISNIESPSFLTHFLSSNLNVEVKDKQSLLEIDDIVKRGTHLLEFLMKEIQLLQLKQEIQSKVHSDIDQQQRDFYIRQQIKVLQDELGDESNDQEIEKLRLRGAKKDWPKPVADHFNRELSKLERMNPMASEYPLSVNYAEFLVDLPWNEYTKDNFDLERARKILDTDHHGLEKVKDRIVEYLSVLKLKKDMKAPILCLYGPPGVGKTSLGKSIAKALGRKYVRMSLGGVRDEAEIRGHRKTYVGAMPGRIISSLKKTQSSNPVFILDEVDKIGSDFRGDPSSALLEVLDPEQNSTFADNYLEVEYDLSKILFIATSNSLDTIQPALMDRMEVIEINGYTLEEKVQIAKKHLIPKQKKEHGLKATDVKFSDASIVKLIDDYTRESGVRNLERKIGGVIRKIAKFIATEEDYNKTLQPEDIVKLIGPEDFEKEIYQENDVAGVVTGLAWTPVGGEILFVESILSKGKGRLTLSGKLGDVMKESAQTALSYLRAHADDLKIDHEVFDNYDLHIHVPAGAVPKDGPSAGITMLTSLASVYTQRKVKAKLAMTGEITLRGKVLPVGGIQEKILAAKRAGINEIILCTKNRKDIMEIKADYIKDLKIHYVDTVEQVLQTALLKDKVKNPVDLSFKDNQSKEKDAVK